MISRIQDWDTIDKLLLGFGVSLVILILVAARGSAMARAAFMDECLQERKQYECTAMWRAGNTSTYVVPVVVR